MLIEDLKNSLKISPPKFHMWDGDYKVGGMGPRQLDQIEVGYNKSHIESNIAIETGAGLSTIWLLALGCVVHSFVLDQEVVKRITNFLMKYPNLLSKWTPHVGASELTLPIWAVENSDLSPRLALIDGGHGIQTALVDTVYVNYIMRKGAYLLIDDQHLGAVKLVEQVITIGGDYEKQTSTEKLGSYVKISDRRLMSDWVSQKQIQLKLELIF